MPEILHLNLHREFFAAIASKKKRIEYRKQSPYAVSAHPAQGAVIGRLAPFHPTDRGKMDAKTIRALVWLAALSLLCATTAWAVDHAVFNSVFFALGTVAVLGAAAPRPRR